MSFAQLNAEVKQKNAILVAVVKNRKISEIQEIINAGAEMLAFNRVQEAAEKFPLLQNFHGRKILIGHLQTNKIKKALEIFDEIHSVDSLKIAEKLNAEAKNLEKKISILLQVNVDEDEQKFGFSVEEVLLQAPFLADLENLEIRGLMTIGKREGDPRETFSALRALFDQIQKSGIFGTSFCELSMGMSGDFRIALDSRATMVRVGSGLFEGE